MSEAVKKLLNQGMRLGRPQSIWSPQSAATSQPMMYHGSDSPVISGPFVPGKRDSGWFGAGMYTSTYPEYAARWGKNLYTAPVPDANYAEAWTDYGQMSFDGLARRADQHAGGTQRWISNPQEYSKAFREALLADGAQGLRVHIGEHPDAEIVIFDPEALGVSLTPYRAPWQK